MPGAGTSSSKKYNHNDPLVTNTIPVITERTNFVDVTDVASGAVSAFAAREPVATNMVTALSRPEKCKIVW